MSANETEAAQDYEQTDREGDLADSAFNHLAEAAVIARLDITSVALFLLATTLANLQFHTGITPADAVRKVEDLIATQVDALAEGHELAPEPEPLSTAAAAGKYH
jgi:hypothetical protein